MAKALYKGVNGVARNIKTHYNGVSGVAKKVDNAYIGVSGVARQYYKSMTLNNLDWATISEISSSGQAANYFSVGDRKAVNINGTVGILSISGTYYCYILGFDHNSSIEGSNRIHFQFGYTALNDGTNIAFCDSNHGTSSYSSCFNMTTSRTNSGGWESCQMRTTICSEFQAALPSELQNVLKTVTKYSDNTGGGSDTASYVTSTTDTIFLLSEYEVVGTRKYANSAEQNYQEQYAYYANGKSGRKYNHSSTDTAVVWWLRSVGCASSRDFCRVNTSTAAQSARGLSSSGFAPGFCV